MLWVMALGPVAILLGWIYCCDKQEKEPLGLLFKCFLLGALSILPIICVELSIPYFFPNTPSGLWSAFIQAFPGAAIPEEIGKFLILCLVIWKHPEFNERFDGIVYAVFISLGFACVENVLYLYGAEGDMYEVGFQRGIFAIPLHFLSAVLMGYFFSLAKFEEKPQLMTVGLFAAILAHGIYDFILFLMTEQGYADYALCLILAFFVFNIILWKIGRKRIRHLMDQSAEDAKRILQEKISEMEDADSTDSSDHMVSKIPRN